jgi:hypothetical protein
MDLRADLVLLWEDLHRGHRTLSDEGYPKDRMLPSEIETLNVTLREQGILLPGEVSRTDQGVSAQESRAGQYMRRLRRLQHRRR